MLSQKKAIEELKELGTELIVIAYNLNDPEVRVSTCSGLNLHRAFAEMVRYTQTGKQGVVVFRREDLDAVSAECGTTVKDWDRSMAPFRAAAKKFHLFSGFGD